MQKEVLTSEEAKKNVDKTLKKYREAQELNTIAVQEFNSAVLRERTAIDIVEGLKSRVKSLSHELAELKGRPNVRDFIMLRTWKRQIGDYLDGNGIFDDVDIEELYNYLKRVVVPLKGPVKS